MFKLKIPLPVLIHRIKTACYALATIVLAGWVTNALNEDLMFKMVLRYFYPEYTANYNHPFDNPYSFYLWFVPLAVGLILMFSASILTVKHMKKRHLYRLKKGKELHRVDHLILSPKVEDLEQVCKTYQQTNVFYFVVPEESMESMLQAANSLLGAENQRLHVFGLKNHDDLHLLEIEFTKTVKAILKQYSNNQSFFFDLTYCDSLTSSAGMFCSLEEDIELVFAKDGHIKSYDVLCEMSD